MKDYFVRIRELVTNHYAFRFHQCGGWGPEFGFYAYRIMQTYNYGLVQGREMIKMIFRAAFNDSRLTDNEAIVIIETCLDSRLDNILMEVNFNEGW